MMPKNRGVRTPAANCLTPGRASHRATWVCFILAVTLCVSGIASAQIPINSSPSIVGSGARALGMGGAFIAVADDATAASWNPGGLTQLERPEISAVYAYKYYEERFREGQRLVPGGWDAVDFGALNYLSIVYPFRHTVAGRNVVISLNYQRRYDFERQLNLSYRLMEFGVTQQGRVDYRQTGSLSALSPALGFEITPRLSMGVVVNFWDQSLIPSNKWKNETRTNLWTRFGALTNPVQVIQEELYDDFSARNYTFGLLYHPTDRLSFGAVYHTGFAADVRHTRRMNRLAINPAASVIRQDRRIEFPASLGLGVAYRFPNDKLTLSMDVTRRNWDRFVEVRRGNTFGEPQRISPITGLEKWRSPHDPTYTVRVGAEYVFINPAKPRQQYLPIVRLGAMYDPEPSGGRKVNILGLGPVTGKSEDYWGVTAGFGLLIKNRVNIDVAYQYRWGRDVRKDTFSMWDVDAKVRQHDLYLSTVVYF